MGERRLLEMVPNHRQIIRAQRDIKVLEEKRSILEGSISNMVAGLSALKGTERSKSVRKIVFMSNDLEDIENNITRVLAVKQPWKETVIPGGVNVRPLCADSQVPETVSVPSTSGHTNGNINVVSVAGVSMPSAVSVPSASVSAVSVPGASVSVREKVAGESSVTEGAGNPPVNSESEVAQGRRVVWDGKRLFRQNVSEVCESQTSRRKNEVKIKWVKERGEFPGRRFVVRNLIKESLGFTHADVFGLVSVTDTEFDLSFKLSQGLDEFWREGGRTGGVCFYPGQPRVCFRCGSNRHFADKRPVVKCTLCGETVHPSKECQEIRCNLCLKLGHVHRSCPDAWHNIVRDCPNLQEEFGQGTEIVEEGAPTSEVVGSEREVVQLESSAPCSKVVDRAAGKLPKEKGDQKASQPRREEKWRVVGKKASIKKKDNSPKIVVATGNRFVLPEGKSWGNLAEEERLREEEKREKRKARSLGKTNRKSKEGKREWGEGFESRGEWESLEEDTEIDLDGEESTPKFQVKRRGEEFGGARQKQNRI
ncbi:hypothetical protein XELAEV_18021162mg [Xenopus laevis]|nr:hypothetical protein XELAEV_18021162mg [Xenopus laevis]